MKFKRALAYAAALLLKPIPRDKHLWLTGKVTSWEYENSPPAFFDNSKYFFLYLVNQTDEKVYWISSSKEEIGLLTSMGLPAVRFPSVKGIWLTLRAKYFFHHYGIDQINYFLQMGSVQLDLWHGTPLKKIRYDVVEKAIEKPNLIKRFLDKGSIEYVSSTSKYLTDQVLSRAFAVKQEHFLNLGYPRTDVMRLKGGENYDFCKRYSPELLPYIDKAIRYDNVFLYMPTYRDDDPEYFEKADIDFELMSKKLKEMKAIFFLKLHPITKHSAVQEYDNIIQISNDVDIYPFLTHTDFLVTDYSSIFFDYLLLDKEIIFIPYDYENYTNNRKLYFDYEEITPGVKFHSFREFVDNLWRIRSINYKKERERVKELFIDDYQFNACEKIYSFIKNK